MDKESGPGYVEKVSICDLLLALPASARLGHGAEILSYSEKCNEVKQGQAPKARPKAVRAQLRRS